MVANHITYYIEADDFRELKDSGPEPLPRAGFLVLRAVRDRNPVN
jgi:hypothetical protein